MDCYEAGRSTEADSVLTRALWTYRTATGDRSPGTADALVALGRLRLRQDRPAEAVPLLEEAVSIRQQLLPPEHERLAEAQATWGRALARSGRVEVARPLLRRGLEGMGIAGERGEPLAEWCRAALELSR